MDGRGLNDIRDHIGASATAANILVQMTNDPLDVIISLQEAYQERTVRSFLSAALSMVPFVPGSIIRKGDNAATAMAKQEARSARHGNNLIHNTFADLPVMSTADVSRVIPVNSTGDLTWAYSVHAHHLYPRWLGGTLTGPTIKVRGYEHITDLEPKLFEHMKRSIPGLTQKSAEQIGIMIRSGRVSQDDITTALFDFYKRRYPNITDEELLDLLQKGLSS